MANPSADYPTSVHSKTDVSGFGSSGLGATTPKHSELEGKQEEEITAVQTKLGTGSSTPTTTNKILYGSGAGASTWGTPANAGIQPQLTEGAFVDGDKTKLNGIETGADVTDATNVAAAGAIMESDYDAKGKILVGTGTSTYSAVAVGNNNEVLTADSTQASGVKWAAAAGGASTYRIKFTMIGDINTTVGGTHIQKDNLGTGSASGTGGGNGAILSTGSTTSGYASYFYDFGTTSTSLHTTFYDKNPACYFFMSMLGDNGNNKMFVGIGAAWQSPSDDGAARKLFGFRFVRSAGATTVYAVNGSGTAETTTNITSSLDGFSAADYNKPTLFWAKMTSGTNIKFYHNRTLVATHTTNLPSGGLSVTISNSLGSFVSNNGSGTSTNALYQRLSFMELDLI